MKLATLRASHGSRAAVVEGDRVRLLDAETAVDALLNDVLGRAWSSEDIRPLASVQFLPVVPEPRKILCAGLNYAGHAAERERQLPPYPTLFAKFGRSLVGAQDPIVLPSVAQEVDWEAELAVVVRTSVKRATASEAAAAIAGFTVANDVSARDWQHRTTQWLQGKTFDRTTPLGPVLVTPDEIGAEPDLRMRCLLNDEVVQDARTSQMIFSAVELVQYVSQFVTFDPGDVILTGTPAGTGAAANPPRFLAPGDRLVTEIEGIGQLVNLCVDEAS